MNINMEEITDEDLAKIKQLLWSRDVGHWKLAHQLLISLELDERKIMEILYFELYNYYWSENRATEWVREFISFDNSRTFEESFNEL